MAVCVNTDRPRRIRLFENGNITITNNSYYIPESEDSIPDDYIAKKTRAGKTTKTFYINNRHYRSVSSSAVKLWHKKVNKIIFVTLTFPEFIQEIDANECFSKFVENLKKNYHLRNYIAVKELTKVGRPHFHCLFDLPFIDVGRLNKAWTMTFRDYMVYSPNALRLGSQKQGTVVKDINRCVKYLTKYMAKCKDTRYKARCIFMNRDLKSEPAELEEADLRAITEAVTGFSWRAIQYEYCTVILLRDTLRFHHKFMRFFTENRQRTISFEHNFT